MKEAKQRLTRLLNEKETPDQKLHLVLGQVKVEKESLALLEQDRNQMFARKGRGEQCATKEERDDWIREETKIVDEQLESKQTQVLELYNFRAKQFDYSMVDGQDAFPIIEKLHYDFEGIISFVFGKTLVCRNMDTMVRLARTSKLDCVRFLSVSSN